jgi:4-hydroxy-3-methylbut-2-enyl diphosphate reductase
MIILRAEALGFCFGVRRAVEKAKRARADFPEARVYTWGPLIHNPAALSRLDQEGIAVFPEDAPASSFPRDAVAVIRAHGIPPAARNELRETVSRVIDASCPRVLANQRMAERFSAEGCFVIIAGDKNHAETKAVAACAEHCAIIENREEAENWAREHQSSGWESCPRLALLAQTTISRAEFAAIADTLKTAFPDIDTRDTICPATSERQEALEKLSQLVDGVLVAGSAQSANTRRLFSRAQTLCRSRQTRATMCALVETASDIPREFFTLDAVGITAGASAPDEIIDAVEDALRKRW